MQKEFERNEVLYQEAKLAMSTQDFAAAMTLLGLLPDEYRRTQTYMQQCQTFETLCKNGVLKRSGTEVIRSWLAEVLGEQDCCSLMLIRYADALARHGFNEESLKLTTMYNVENVIYLARMSRGHRQLLEKYAEENTPMLGRVWMKLLVSVQRCGPVIACFQDSVRRKASDGDETNETRREDRMEDLKWKLGQQFFFGTDREDDKEEH